MVQNSWRSSGYSCKLGIFFRKYFLEFSRIRLKSDKMMEVVDCSMSDLKLSNNNQNILTQPYLFRCAVTIKLFDCEKIRKTVRVFQFYLQFHTNFIQNYTKV